MKKHYVRKNEDDSLTYIGWHGAAPRNSIEISEELVGKSLMVVESEPNEMGEIQSTVIVDEDREQERLAAKEDKHAKEAQEAVDLQALVEEFKALDPATCTNLASTRTYLKKQRRFLKRMFKHMLGEEE